MARPKKRTVDYFPHIIKNGKTITILENKYGNDGYAFWFKLLEILGDTDGHFYEYKNTADKEFLHARTLVDGDTAKEILDLLADLNAIDPELWEHNIIWSDNFVDNIEDAYSRRKVNVPQKPTINKVNDDINSNKKGKCSNDDNKNSQSKVNKSKVNKNIKPSDKSDTESGDKFSLQGQTDGGYYIYPDEYEKIYELYPANNGSKKAGWRKWAATRRRGVSKEDLTTAVSNYAKVCEREDRDKKYVKHIGTFFGPDEHWKEYLEIDEENINVRKLSEKQKEEIQQFMKG